MIVHLLKTKFGSIGIKHICVVSCRVKFKDPQFAEGFVFKAVLLPGAKLVTRSHLIKVFWYFYCLV